MKILITGASGAVGSHITKLEGHEIVRQRINIQNAFDVRHKISEIKPDVIIHLASVTQVKEKDRERAYSVNVAGTKHLALAAVENGVKKFIFASSSAVYPLGERPVKESEATSRPHTYYGQTKIEAEAALAEASKNTDMKVIVFRIFNIYGTGFDGSLINKLVSGKEVSLRNPEYYYRDYIHVSEVVKFLELAVNKNLPDQFSVLNLGSGRIRSTSDLVWELRKAGILMKFNIYLKKPVALDISWANIERLVEAFGIKPISELTLS